MSKSDKIDLIALINLNNDQTPILKIRNLVIGKLFRT